LVFYFCLCFSVVEKSSERAQADEELELKQSLPHSCHRSSDSIDRLHDHRSNSRLDDQHRASSRSSRQNRPEEQPSSSSRNSQLDEGRRLSQSGRLQGRGGGSGRSSHLDRGGSGASSLNATLDRDSRGSSCDRSEIQAIPAAEAKLAAERLSETAAAAAKSVSGRLSSPARDADAAVCNNSVSKNVEKPPMNGACQVGVRTLQDNCIKSASPGSESTAGSLHSLHTRNGLQS
jgi:hypothetical protein